MNCWILCCGTPETPLPSRCTGAAFEAAWEALPRGGVRPCPDKPLKGSYPLVFASPGLRAAQTAAQLLPGAMVREEPLLAPIPRRACRDGDQERPLRFWTWRARRQARKGDPRQPESLAGSRARAEALIKRLDLAGEDCVLIAEESLLPLLLDSLRVRGYCFARSGFGAFRPWERILATQREAHCGGCAHNCFLSNPGCNIGRDKARRLKEGRRA